MKQKRKPTPAELQQYVDLQIARIKAKLLRMEADQIERTAHGSSIAAQASTQYGRKKRRAPNPKSKIQNPKSTGPDTSAKGEPSRV